MFTLVRIKPHTFSPIEPSHLAPIETVAANQGEFIDSEDGRTGLEEQKESNPGKYSLLQ